MIHDLSRYEAVDELGVVADINKQSHLNPTSYFVSYKPATLSVPRAAKVDEAWTISA
jgi:hypothetical protein